MRWVLVGATAALLLATATTRADAAPWLRLYDGTTAITVTDGGVGDSNATAGVVTYIGSVGNFTVNVSTGSTKPAIGDASNAKVDLNSVNTYNGTGPGTLELTWSDDNFTLPSGPLAFATASVGGTLETGSGVTFTAWANPLNMMPLPGGPPTLIPPGSINIQNFTIPPPTTGGFLNNSSAQFAMAGPFALFVRDTLTATAPGQSVSFNQSLDAAVPEPASLTLLGTGLVGLAGSIRRRYGKRAKNA